MARMLAALVATILCSAGMSIAQERAGAGRVEIGSGVFGGGLVFTQSPGAGPSAGGYLVNVALSTNVTNTIGVEGDVSWVLKRSQALSLYGAAPPNQKMPGMLLYSGNLIFSPRGRDRAVVPYANAGAGSLTVFDAGDAPTVPIAQGTHLTADVGGGVRWFPVRHWGVRGDYRYVIVDRRGSLAGGEPPVRALHRVYIALVLTF